MRLLQIFNSTKPNSTKPKKLYPKPIDLEEFLGLHCKSIALRNEAQFSLKWKKKSPQCIALYNGMQGFHPH